MYQGKYSHTTPAASASRRRGRRRLNPRFVLLVCMALIVTSLVGGTLAYLLTQTDPLVNTFEPGKVPVTIPEEFNGETKSNVTVKNTGNVEAYIRAKVVVTWKDGDAIAPTVPVPGAEGSTEDYYIEYNVNDGSKWVLHTDGYYYYTVPVSAGGETDVLINKCYQLQPSDYQLCVDILAESIQADGVDGIGMHPVTLAWGSHVTVNDDGTLSVG